MSAIHMVTHQKGTFIRAFRMIQAYAKGLNTSLSSLPPLLLIVAARLIVDLVGGAMELVSDDGKVAVHDGLAELINKAASMYAMKRHIFPHLVGVFSDHLLLVDGSVACGGVVFDQDVVGDIARGRAEGWLGRDRAKTAARAEVGSSSRMVGDGQPWL
ncbi:uncharacterized protein ARMOST_09866 [Armillaria ostoyae]|uniref:Uncharacterized protein n=1 Tax=Armillaria ostoyae TaxID=47428 RepID=A0A284RCS4_ARMOS|nr:uncharacterized protein ARMOST_09866 [Armillaria ostoyae]